MLRNHLKILIVSVLISSINMQALPILLWHSAGESYSGNEMSLYTNFLRSQLGDGIYIRSVSLDDDPGRDLIKSLTIHPFDQIKQVCAMLQNDPNFHNGYNAIGLSQGGLFARGLAQVCPFPPMRNLISLGAPQQGTQRYPRCEKQFGFLCNSLQTAITTFGYMFPFQRTIAPLTYWHDTDEQRYKRGSTFLALINNENDYNANFVINLNNLRRIVLVKYEHDGVIVPGQSAWFGFHDKQGIEHPMEETEIYKLDKLGLRSMRENGKIIFLSAPNDHLELDRVWFALNIIPYLLEP